MSLKADSYCIEVSPEDRFHHIEVTPEDRFHCIMCIEESPEDRFRHIEVTPEDRFHCIEVSPEGRFLMYRGVPRRQVSPDRGDP